MPRERRGTWNQTLSSSGTTRQMVRCREGLASPSPHSLPQGPKGTRPWRRTQEPFPPCSARRPQPARKQVIGVCTLIRSAVRLAQRADRLRHLDSGARLAHTCVSRCVGPSEPPAAILFCFLLVGWLVGGFVGLFQQPQMRRRKKEEEYTSTPLLSCRCALRFRIFFPTLSTLGHFQFYLCPLFSRDEGGFGI